MAKGFVQTPLLIVKYNKERGKGGRAVYARKNISRGALIEWAPCLMIPEKEIGDDWSQQLPWYVFEWENGYNGLALGYVSLYNHSYQPNAYYEMQEPDCMIIWAKEDIVAGDEITINYNGEPGDQTDVGFRVNGRGSPNIKLPKAKKGKKSVKRKKVAG